jgi:hypothetical protein
MMMLVFHPCLSGSPVQVRGAYFRICADATLRGPDNEVAAAFIEHSWHLARRRFRDFQSSTPVYLRVTNQNGEREQLGPFELFRVAEGALFSAERCVGTHSANWATPSVAACWREIVILPSAPDASSEGVKG